jgi:hypothetical protein
VTHWQRESRGILKLGEMEARETMAERIGRQFADSGAALGGFQ